MHISTFVDLLASHGLGVVMPMDEAESAGPRVPVGGWQPRSWKGLFLTARIVLGCHRCAGARRHPYYFKPDN